jgi:hypothetical protein
MVNKIHKIMQGDMKKSGWSYGILEMAFQEKLTTNKIATVEIILDYELQLLF